MSRRPRQGPAPDPSAGRAWLWVGLWAFIIWFLGGESLSLDNTSRFLGPLLRWLLPDIEQATTAQIQFAIRKAAHLTEYCVLSFVTLRALLLSRSLLSRSSLSQSPVRSRRSEPDTERGNPRRAAFAALCLAAAFATADETRQSFSMSRSGAASDVALDTLGALAGIGLLLWARARLPSLATRIGLLAPSAKVGSGDTHKGTTE